MKFGKLKVADAVGALLAHGQSFGPLRLAKGHCLSANDIARIRAGGTEYIVAAELEPGDIGENDVAAMVAAGITGTGVKAAIAHHGRVNLVAEIAGLVAFNENAVRELSRASEDVTVAVVSPMTTVRAGDIIATIKVIPYAVEGDRLASVFACSERVKIEIAAFKRKTFALVQTVLPGFNPKLFEKTRTALRARIEHIGGCFAAEIVCEHGAAPLAGVLRDKAHSQIILVASASATVDRRDVVPAAIEIAGGRVERVGMPVDPGNLLCIGWLGASAVIGLPGCARSTLRNGIDLILERLSAGVAVDACTIADMAVGGLMPETLERPEPRGSVKPSRRRGVAAIVLAAGTASRMGTNKLTEPLGDKPVVAHAVDAVLEAGLVGPIVVVGYEQQRVKAALANRMVRYVEARNYGQGLSASLRAGLSAVPADVSAALVCLGDMPFVSAQLIRQLADLATEETIIVPRFNGRAGNPVAWGRTFFHELALLEGDRGGKALFTDHADRIVYVETEDEGARLDVDTQQMLFSARERIAHAAP